jgi:hypothetical protein
VEEFPLVLWCGALALQDSHDGDRQN